MPPLPAVAVFELALFSMDALPPAPPDPPVPVLPPLVPAAPCRRWRSRFRC